MTPTLEGSKASHERLNLEKQCTPPQRRPPAPPCCPAEDLPSSKGWPSTPSLSSSLEAAVDRCPTRTSRSLCVVELPHRCSNVRRPSGRKCGRKSRRTELPPRSSSSSPAWTRTQTPLRRDPCSASCRRPEPPPRTRWGSRDLRRGRADRRRGSRAGCSSSEKVSNGRVPSRTPLVEIKRCWTNLRINYINFFDENCLSYSILRWRVLGRASCHPYSEENSLKTLWYKV